MKYTIYCDGGVYNNQIRWKRHAYLSLKIFDEDENLIDHTQDWEVGDKNTTNNQCEYMAIQAGLDKIPSLKNATELQIYSDSQLVVKQLSGEFRVKSEAIKVLYDKVKHDIAMFTIPITISWITRDTIHSILGH